MVAGNRLGVLNHTRLTIEALERRGATIAGVVLNTLHGGEATLAERSNAAELQRLLPLTAPLLGRFPFLPAESRRDPAALAAVG